MWDPRLLLSPRGSSDDSGTEAKPCKTEIEASLSGVQPPKFSSPAGLPG